MVFILIREYRRATLLWSSQHQGASSTPAGVRAVCCFWRALIGFVRTVLDQVWNLDAYTIKSFPLLRKGREGAFFVWYQPAVYLFNQMGRLQVFLTSVGGGFGKLKTNINHSPVEGEYKMSFLFNWLQYHFNLVCVLTITTNCNSTITRVGRKSGLCALMTHVAATIARLQITANIHDVQEVRLTFHNLFWCQCLRSFH